MHRQRPASLFGIEGEPSRFLVKLFAGHVLIPPHAPLAFPGFYPFLAAICLSNLLVFFADIGAGRRLPPPHSRGVFLPARIHAWIVLNRVFSYGVPTRPKTALSSQRTFSFSTAFHSMIT